MKLTTLPLVIALVAIAGCASAPKVAEKTGVDNRPVTLAEKRDQDLFKVTNWKIDGRLGVQMPSDGFSSGVSWEQKGESYEINITDPLGRIVAQLKGDWTNVSLSLDDGRVLRAKDPDQMMQAALGWSLPVKSLVYWVRGLPDPEKVAWRREYDDGGRLTRLDQEGWVVEFSRYIDSNRINQSFPSLTRFAHKDFKVKLLIQEWN